MEGRTRATHALRHLTSEYIRERRTAGELRSRLVSVVHERSRLSDGIPTESQGERTQRQLDELEHVRGTLERSARAADARVGALEGVIAAIVAAGGGLPSAPERTQAPPLPDARPEPEPQPLPATPTDPQPWVRGGFSPPPRTP